MKNIAITVDKNYCIHAAVMLYSLLSNNNPADINIHVILNFRNSIFRIPIKYVLLRKRCRHTFYMIREKDIPFAEDLIITQHISIATYFRLFLPTLLKKTDKVLFLDSDIIVDGNIDELYAVNISEHPLAAVIHNDDERFATLELNQGYFNAGVMLLNLDYLRKNDYELKFQAFIKNHPDKIKYWDQDVLNAVTRDSFVPLKNQWNFLSTNYEENTKPVIIHYAGYHKPWNVHYDKFFRENYFEYLHRDKFLFFINLLFNAYFGITKRISNLFK